MPAQSSRQLLHPPELSELPPRVQRGAGLVEPGREAGEIDPELPGWPGTVAAGDHLDDPIEVPEPNRTIEPELPEAFHPVGAERAEHEEPSRVLRRRGRHHGASGELAEDIE